MILLFDCTGSDQVIQNHGECYSTGQGEVLHRKYKRLNLVAVRLMTVQLTKLSIKLSRTDPA